MIVVNTHEAKTKLSQLLACVEDKHEKVRICRHGKAIADIVPITNAMNHLAQHKEIMGVKIFYDPTTLLSDDEWPEQYR